MELFSGSFQDESLIRKLRTAYERKDERTLAVFDRLSDELLERILAYFSDSAQRFLRALRISRRFQRVARDLWSTWHVLRFGTSNGQRANVDMRKFIESHALELDRTQFVDLSNLENIRDEDLVLLAQHCPSMSVLNVSQCRSVTSSALLRLAEFCPSLREVDLSGCCSVTDIAIISLVKHCQQLSRVVVSQCWKLTQRTLIALMKEAQSLESLNIAEAISVNYDELYGLLSACSFLRDVVISCINILSEEDIHALRRDFPNVRLIAAVEQMALWIPPPHFRPFPMFPTAFAI